MKIDASMSTAAAQAAGKTLQNTDVSQSTKIGRIATEEQGAEFIGQVREALDSLVETGAEVDHSVMELMGGGETDLHTSMVQMGRTDLELRFVVQVRNRAIAAYEEVMRLQV